MKVFHIFLVRVWNTEQFHVDLIGIKYNNYDRPVTHQLQNEELNNGINIFILHMVLQNVGLLWITENRKHLKFEINAQKSSMI